MNFEVANNGVNESYITDESKIVAVRTDFSFSSRDDILKCPFFDECGSAGRDLDGTVLFTRYVITWDLCICTPVSFTDVSERHKYFLRLAFPQLDPSVHAGQSSTLVGTTSLFASGNNPVGDGSTIARSRQEPCSPTTFNPRQSSQTVSILLLSFFTIAITIKPRTPLTCGCELDSVATAPNTDLCS